MIRKILLAAAAALWVGSPAVAADLGVSVHVTDPGLYGRVDIGSVPAQPVLVYPQPIVVAPQPIAVQRSPIYLHVPPGHAKNWGKHCHRYGACAQPVYFVQEGWYREHVHSVHEHRGKKHDKYEKKLAKEQRKHEKHHAKHHGKHDD